MQEWTKESDAELSEMLRLTEKSLVEGNDMPMPEDEYEPTADERALIDTVCKPMAALQADLLAILRTIIRLRKLNGNWTWNGKKIVRQGEIQQ